MDWGSATFDEVVETLQNEIAVHCPGVRRRIELFTIPDQLSSEGPLEFWQHVVSKCKEGAIGSRTMGLELNHDQFLITLFLKGLKESDRERIHQKFMNYDASYEEMEEVVKSLEQNSISLKASTAKSKGMVNATSSSACNKCKRTDHTTQNCKTILFAV